MEFLNDTSMSLYYVKFQKVFDISKSVFINYLLYLVPFLPPTLVFPSSLSFPSLEPSKKLGKKGTNCRFERIDKVGQRYHSRPTKGVRAEDYVTKCRREIG